MENEPFLLSGALHTRIENALRQVRQQVRWKPGKAQTHLEKRIRLQHLSPTATLADYEMLIRAVLYQTEAKVYLFEFAAILYPTIVASYQGRQWLVMFDLTGIMETAFPPDDPITYFADPKYKWAGLIEEFLS